MPTLPAIQAYRVVGVTYEQTPAGLWLPVVRHEFYGATPDGALHVRASHLQADRFLGSCELGSFGQVVCRTRWYDVERTA